MPQLGNDWVETAERPAARVVNDKRFKDRDPSEAMREINRIIPVELDNPDFAVRTLAGCVGALALLTMDARLTKRQVTYGSFRRLLNPAYDYVFGLVKMHDPRLWVKPEAKAKYLHSLAVDFHPTEAFIGVRVTYRDIEFEHTYRFRIEPKNKDHLATIPLLAQMDDRPHQKLQPLL